ncbi:MAG: LptF/LptG family permease [Bacillota bacterium]
MKIVHQHVVREIALTFFFFTFAFCLLLLGEYLFELTDLLFGKKVPLLDVGSLAFFKLPALLMDAFPVAILFAVMFVFGRMVKDGELSVVRNAGWSLVRVTYPILILSAGMSVFLFYWNDMVVPISNHLSENIIRRLCFNEPFYLEEGIVFKGPDNRYFIVDKVIRAAKRVYGITIVEKKGLFPRIITARQGYLEKDKWILEDGNWMELDKDGDIVFTSSFQRSELDTNADLSVFLGEQKTTDEMSRDELLYYIKMFKGSGQRYAPFLVDYYRKVSSSLLPLVLCLIGLPFGLTKTKRGRLIGLVIAVILTFLFYGTEAIFRTMGFNDTVPAVVAAFLPTFFYGGLGIFLLIWWDR